MHGTFVEMGEIEIGFTKFSPVPWKLPGIGASGTQARLVNHIKPRGGAVDGYSRPDVSNCLAGIIQAQYYWELDQRDTDRGSISSV